jgi:UDP:flavonoid glycosyltransferase YjiC (YdhE family)
MAEIVNHFGLGIVAEDFTPKKLAEKLNAVTTEKLEDYKKNSKKAAVELSAQKNELLLNRIINELIG